MEYPESPASPKSRSTTSSDYTFKYNLHHGAGYTRLLLMGWRSVAEQERDVLTSSHFCPKTHLMSLSFLNWSICTTFKRLCFGNFYLYTTVLVSALCI